MTAAGIPIKDLANGEMVPVPKGIEEKMMNVRIIPNYVKEAINSLIDQIPKPPDFTEADQDNIYRTLLDYFDKYGRLPTAFDCRLVPVDSEG